jgi:hypothetical protein
VSEITDLIVDSFKRGVTFRKTLYGERPMFHRWPASKIRGSITALEFMCRSIYRTNPLLMALQARK